MLKLMLITNDPELAAFAVDCGVDRIFVDLEVLGKLERQGHLDTVKNRHTIEDIARVRAAIPGAELLVRLNPLHDGTVAETERALEAGANLLMLPMAANAAEVERFVTAVAGRAATIALVETANGARELERIVRVANLSEIYIGLNDLHLSLRQTFMFQPLADGMIDEMAAVIRRAGLPFGFGGLARIGEGKLPAELVISEHLRLGSSCAILSRTFHRHDEGLSPLQDKSSFRAAVARLRETERELAASGNFAANHARVREIVGAIVREKGKA